MKCLILRFEAPLMSFGGVLVDQHNPTDRFPGRSLLTGLIGNALGWSHRQVDALNALQARITYAARWDVRPNAIRDYHTVDLTQRHLADPGWTTRGTTEHRGGEKKKNKTHERYRHYWADGVLTVALTLSAGDPDLDAVAAALRHPARPLFLGRKTCLPTAPVFRACRDAPDVLAALKSEPADPRTDAKINEEVGMEACWPPELSGPDVDVGQRQYRTDDREWRNQVHVGQRPMVEGRIREVPPCT